MGAGPTPLDGQWAIDAALTEVEPAWVKAEVYPPFDYEESDEEPADIIAAASAFGGKIAPIQIDPLMA